MALFTRTPGNYFLAHNATLVGDVTVGELASFWFNAVVRGDVAKVEIGRRTNVQDGVVIHCDTDVPNVIGDDVTIGHRAVVHGASVGRGTLIGMGAILLSGSVVGDEALVAAGAVVREGFQVPDGTLVAGVPAKVIRALGAEERKLLRRSAEGYVRKLRLYLPD